MTELLVRFTLLQACTNVNIQLTVELMEGQNQWFCKINYKLISIWTSSFWSIVFGAAAAYNFLEFLDSYVCYALSNESIWIRLKIDAKQRHCIRDLYIVLT